MSIYATVGLIALLAPQAGRPEGGENLGEAIARLRFQIAALDGLMRQREESNERLARELKALGEKVVAREAEAPPVSAPFLASPPPSSDSVGIAKFAVFAPRVEVDASRRHDSVAFKVRRLEANAIRAVGEADLGSDQAGVDLPLDVNGALYLVDWTTSDGQSHNLVLRDGATGQAAATVQVKPYQARGRLIFVGYRLE